MSNQTPSLLQQANSAIERGNSAEARRLLLQAVEQNPQNYRAWQMLAQVTTSPKAAQEYQQRAADLRTANRPVPAPVQSAPQETIKKTVVPTAVPPKAIPPASRPQRKKPNALFMAIGAGILVALCLAGVMFGGSLLSAGARDDGTAVAANAPNQALDPNGTPAPNDFIAENMNALGAWVRGETPVPTATFTPIPTNTLPPTPTLAPTSTATPTPLPTPTVIPTFVSEQNQTNGRPAIVADGERWIDVNLSNQTLVAYEGDTAVFDTFISSGLSQWPTVVGQFRTYMKYETQTMNGYLLGYDYYIQDVPYVMYFFEDYAIHGAYWHNNFGTPMSHGCVNVEPTEAGWLFGWAPTGTVVNVHY